jgi:hypothetical protein
VPPSLIVIGINGALAVTKAAEFRANADECQQKAHQTKDVEAKRVLLEAAQEWRALAAQAERRGE